MSSTGATVRWSILDLLSVVSELFEHFSTNLGEAGWPPSSLMALCQVHTVPEHGDGRIDTPPRLKWLAHWFATGPAPTRSGIA